MKLKHLLIAVFLLSLSQLVAQVKYDEGRVQIDGIQLLQDSTDENAYYYLTRFVRLSTKDDGSYELLCIKYVGEGDSASGGLFHALIEFSLPQDVIEAVEVKLKQQKGESAYIAGPVPMKQTVNENTNEVGKFNVVSSILTNTEGEDAFTSNVITSGFSPLLPNSKAAIAAKLNPAGATLLWESLSGATSDVSVSIHGYYEAKVKGYNAIISAEAETVYEHYSRVINSQEGYSKQQLRKISDEMVQNQVINVEVFDRSEGLGIDTKDMQSIVDIITDKLVEVMFDTKAGWAKQPEGEVAVEAGQLKGRQERGWFSSTFGGAQNTPYFSDNQYVVKKRKDVKSNKFYLNLSKSTTIKVPTHTSGNIAGIYGTLKDDERYFRVVNLADSDFQKREVFFQIDGGFSDSFNDILNSVSISFKKVYGENKDDATSDLLFTNKDLNAGKDFKTIVYPRLGIEGSEWLDYEYKMSWNLKGETKPIIIPKAANQWKSENLSLIALVPPFKKKIIDIDADRSAFKDANIKTATIRFFSILNGKASAQRTIILRENDAENTMQAILYYDEGEPLAYQITWYSKNGKYSEKIKELEEDYVFLIIPSAEDFQN
jgi:hypothetical protein